MTVWELIKELKKYDEKMQVVVDDWEDYTHDDCIELNKEVQSFMIWEDWKPIGSRIDKTIEEALHKTKNWDRVERREILVIYADY